ncbi:hypothetical protein [Chitiniphilus shinanonensis]|uniref:hypothetical protein n=1 Tax=Chitiniphilus shinanonensis TaxID=553088 RepID=UPI003057C60C
MSENDPDREPVIEIVTTSDEDEAPDAPAPSVVLPPGQASFLHRYRLPLLLGGGALLGLLLLGVGLLLGMFVREFNEKQYVDQIVLLRGALEKNAEARDTAHQELAAAAAERQALENERDGLKEQLALSQQALKSALAQISTLTPAPEPKIEPGPDGNSGYLRFGNKNCLIRPGQDRAELEKCLRGD